MKRSIISALLTSFILMSPPLWAVDDLIKFEETRENVEPQQQAEASTPEDGSSIHVTVALESGLQNNKKGEPPIDRERAQQWHGEAQKGEKLSSEEQAYYDRARAEPGARNRLENRPRPSHQTAHLKPLTELGTGKYKGQDGGLYGSGSNQPPLEHLTAALQEAAKILPLDKDGRESNNGKIGVISVGMSNTTMEYSRFQQLANIDPVKSKHVIIVDGAQGGQSAKRWADQSAPLWKRVADRLNAARLSRNQIQVAWMKQAEARPAQYGEFPRHAKQLQENLAIGLANLKRKFPNLRIVYLSSRIYAGYATTELNPEPYAYEGAFSMRWLIQDQIAGRPELNYDESKGLVNSPLLLWGPYLWANGETPRRADGLVYKREDFSKKDGTHPANSARKKVAEQLLDFFKTDPTARSWFTLAHRSPKGASTEKRIPVEAKIRPH